MPASDADGGECRPARLENRIDEGFDWGKDVWKRWKGPPERMRLGAERDIHTLLSITPAGGEVLGNDW